jgi:nucleoside-diphosphate-sugar epimerase
LHGAHLVAGTPRMRLWENNVIGTQNVLAAAAGAQRLVFASSTSVYGSGTPAPQPARVLTEKTALKPEDVYDLSKMAAEQLLRREFPERSVILRFGRFFYRNQDDYQLRKLSTGLDVRDACQAVALAMIRPAAHPAYCVASDLALSYEQRRHLGIDARAVLREALPDLVPEMERYQIPIPERVGKSVDTTLIRADLEYRPERDLSWYFREVVADSKRSYAGPARPSGTIPTQESAPIAISRRAPISSLSERPPAHAH